MVAHACNPSKQEDLEFETHRVQGQPELYSKTVSKKPFIFFGRNKQSFLLSIMHTFLEFSIMIDGFKYFLLVKSLLQYGKCLIIAAAEVFL
jgi:hypothetical protein